jgi:general secretion pathway protein B
MSFILDALKKSETERQQQTGAEFSSIPSSSGEPQSFKWLWILALLLLVNVAVLFGILLRPDKPAAVPPPVETTPAETRPAESSQPAEPSFEERVAEARQNQPAVDVPMTDASATPEPAPEPAVAPSAPTSTASTASRLMTIDELRLSGSLQLPELHLDIHVFADDPAERFVFINMSKYREKSRLDEGPVVAEITPDGVVLEHQGRRFLLPRE